MYFFILGYSFLLKFNAFCVQYGFWWYISLGISMIIACSGCIKLSCIDCIKLSYRLTLHVTDQLIMADHNRGPSRSRSQSRSRSRSPTASEVAAGIDDNFLRFLRRHIIVCKSSCLHLYSLYCRKYWKSSVGHPVLHRLLTIRSQVRNIHPELIHLLSHRQLRQEVGVEEGGPGVGEAEEEVVEDVQVVLLTLLLRVN